MNCYIQQYNRIPYIDHLEDRTIRRPWIISPRVTPSENETSLLICILPTSQLVAIWSSNTMIQIVGN